MTNLMKKVDQIGYRATHSWLYKSFEGINFCEACGNENAKEYDWANISGEYKRDINDWLRLCRKCHVRFDGMCERMSKLNTGRPSWWKGKHLSEEIKSKISNSCIGRKAWNKGLKGVQPAYWLGKHRSQETIAKIKETYRKKYATESEDINF